jgi:hypothetical protein
MYPTFWQALNKKWFAIGLISAIAFGLSMNPIGWMMSGMSMLLLLTLAYNAESTSIGIFRN